MNHTCPDEEDIECCLDYRLRGETQSTHGLVTWTLNHTYFLERKIQNL